MKWLDRLLGHYEPAPEVQAAREKQAQDFRELEDAVDAANESTGRLNRLRNGIIRDFEQVERERRKP